MKTLLLLTLILAGCGHVASQDGQVKNQTLLLDKEIPGMSRNEVILAINECENNKTRAVMIFAKRKINNITTDIVVDVTCAPAYYTGWERR
jgi:hypothetical protein